MYYIIVRRGQHQQYDALYTAFGARLPVIWDRRRPPLPGRDPAPNGARGDRPERRNGTPPSWAALDFVVADVNT
ncbi:MAG: hypothetical protein ACRD3C_22785 [Vicinamibacterales bacterium]